MQITYKRNGLKNYMIVKNDKDETPGLREKMIIRNEIPYLARMTPQSIDGHTYFYYDIQGRLSLKALFEGRSFTGSEIRTILNGLSGLLSGLQRYLLSPDEVLFDPADIWVLPDTLEPSFIYVPDLVKDERYGIHSLAEFLSEHVDGSDRDAAGMAFSYLEMVENGYIVPEPPSPSKDITPEMNGAPEKNRSSVPPIDPDEYWDLKEGISDEMKPFFEETDASDGKPFRKKISYILIGIMILSAAVYVAFVLDPSLFPIYLTDEEYIAAGAVIAVVFAIVLISVTLICGRKDPLPEEDTFKDDSPAPIRCDDPADKLEYMEYRDDPDDDDEKTVLLKRPAFDRIHQYPCLRFNNGRQLDITTFPYLIGKMKNRVDGVVEGDGVSRIHAMIKETDGRYYILDLNSLNGTAVNGKSLEANETAEIHEGDIISLADTSLTFHCHSPKCSS